MTTIIGIALLIAAVVAFAFSPGYGALLTLVLVGYCHLVEIGGTPGKDWTAAIIFTMAAGYFLWSTAEGLVRILT